MANIKDPSYHKRIYNDNANFGSTSSSVATQAPYLAPLQTVVKAEHTLFLPHPSLPSDANAYSYNKIDGNERWVVGLMSINNQSEMPHYERYFIVNDRWDSGNVFVIDPANNIPHGYCLSGNLFAYFEERDTPFLGQSYIVVRNLLTGKSIKIFHPNPENGWKFGNAIAIKGNLLLAAQWYGTNSTYSDVLAYDLSTDAFDDPLNVTPKWTTQIPQLGTDITIIDDIVIGNRYAYVSIRGVVDPNGTSLASKGVVRALDLQSNGALMSFWITRGENSYTNTSRQFGHWMTWDPEWKQIYIGYGSQDVNVDVQRYSETGSFIETLRPNPSSNLANSFSLGYDDPFTKLPVAYIAESSTGWLYGKLFQILSGSGTLAQTPLIEGGNSASASYEQNSYYLGMRVGDSGGITGSATIHYSMRDIKGMDVLIGRSVGRKW